MMEMEKDKGVASFILTREEKAATATVIILFSATLTFSR